MTARSGKSPRGTNGSGTGGSGTGGSRAHGSRTEPGRIRRPAVAFARLACVTALAVVATGCGIRTTSVPVDAGHAPSRMPCEVSPGKDVITSRNPGVPVRVYLVCASGLAPVERAAQIPDGKTLDSRLRIGQGLLDELQAQPSSTERNAGFTTSVRGPLLVSGPREGDPSGTLRLNRQPEDLPPTALAQIVCTFAESGATDGKVVLGGPGDYPVHGYACDRQTKNHPDETAPTRAASASSSASASPSASASASASPSGSSAASSA